ncbi:D-Ala-D-Ala carboxypeptidase family metallohydrolase [Picosynechococcus sp. NKBG15041c]|uniref:D-Ala-D-Ala carboxypeptidase family metallohydrolase n=1 Tax=Picosynechococcus sp. NKBG15041c TaxID=1407650 RepID=UPI0004674697|nr:D-Ala-D-Ala carboxypeptidase family metallohydrolase [Picosynechococcus sp. NKBG15041c]
MINWKDRNAKVSRYFTVGEVIQNDDRRIPTSPQVQLNIIRLAWELDKVRAEWGAPIGVTSWHRPTAINKAIGGVANSPHIEGLAADIYPIGRDLMQFQTWLDARWYGRLGYGAKKGFVHVDLRGGKGFNSAGAKGTRWNY